ncbi:hypothetical protein BDZ97DRAFT_1923396 [Flammula alnicola]|nr:hypothetical protein BDZ97DRAFT_1923396 [Flammula alnicola]
MVRLRSVAILGAHLPAEPRHGMNHRKRDRNDATGPDNQPEKSSKRPKKSHKRPKKSKMVAPEFGSPELSRTIPTGMASNSNTTDASLSRQSEDDERRERLRQEVNDLVQAHLRSVEEDPNRLFGEDYQRLRELASRDWEDLLPGLDDMPVNWPGRGLEHGLSDMHLAPAFWTRHYTAGDRDESGRRKGTWYNAHIPFVPLPVDVGAFNDLGNGMANGMQTLPTPTPAQDENMDPRSPAPPRSNTDDIETAFPKSAGPTDSVSSDVEMDLGGSAPPPISEEEEDPFEPHPSTAITPPVSDNEEDPFEPPPSSSTGVTPPASDNEEDPFEPPPSSSTGVTPPISDNEEDLFSQSRLSSSPPKPDSGYSAAKKVFILRRRQPQGVRGSSAASSSSQTVVAKPANRKGSRKARDASVSVTTGDTSLETSCKTPDDLVGRMDAVSYLQLNAGECVAISNFFKEFTLLNRQFKDADRQSKEGTELSNNGMDLVWKCVDTFFRSYAMIGIPSKDAFYELTASRQSKVKSVAIAIRKLSKETLLRDQLWASDAPKIRLRGLFFVARCWEWAALSSD